MLTENQINALPERIYQRLNAINTECLEDIGKIIKDIGELRPSDVHKLQQMHEYGAKVDDIARKLAQASEKNIAEIYEIFDIVAKENYNYAKPFYEAKDLPFVPYEKNEKLQQYVKSLAKQTVGEYVNLTQNTAFAVFGAGNSVAPLFEANKGKVATSLSDTYNKVIDYATAKAQLGVTDYHSAMRSCIKALATSGIRTVDYASGYSRRLDTAVRQNVLWGIKQCNQNVADLVGKEFGADGYEISYHSHPRPSHAEMGGRQYARGKARTINGVYYPSFEEEAEPLLNDYGCLHFQFSILLGVSRPAYSKAQLEEFKAEDRKTFVFEGKKYTKYEASQLQRRVETEIRHQKDLANIAKAAGDDDLRREAQYKINLLTNKYAKLADASGLPTKMERMDVRGFRSTKTGKSKIAFNSKPGGSVNASVNMSFINSQKYTDKFRGLTNIEKVDGIIAEKSKTILKNRNGTLFEELFAIDAYTGRTLTYIKGKDKKSVQMTKKLEKLLTNSNENSIIIIHNHPDSSTLSAKDIITMLDYKSISHTVAAGHDGTVFSISNIPRDKKIIEDFRLSYTKNIKEWSDYTAREKAWQEVAKKWGFAYERK